MKLTVKSIKGLKSKVKRYIVWDDAGGLRLGVRVTPSGRKMYVLDFRAPDGRQRRMVIGDTRNMPPTEARRVGRKYLADIAAGDDPLKTKETLRKEREAAKEKTMTVSALWERYVDDYINHPHPATRKGRRPLSPKTRVEYLRQWRVHLERAFGDSVVASVTHDDVAAFHTKVGGTSPFLANRLAATLGSLFSFGYDSRLITRTMNPAHHINKFDEPQRHRLLNGEEMGRLGAVLRIAEEGGGTFAGEPVCNEPWQAIAAIRLGLLTGVRKSALLNLRWSDIDHDRGIVTIARAKRGSRTIYLTTPVENILDGIPRTKDSPWVFQSDRRRDKPFSGLQLVWSRIRKAAGIKPVWNPELERWEDARIHDFRHTAASEGLGGDLPLAVIKDILGHKETKTTERYARLERSPVRAGAKIISDRISKKLDQSPEGEGGEPTNVVAFR